MVKKTLRAKARRDPKVETLPKSNYEEGKWYTFNVNPNDDYQHWNSNGIHRDRSCVKSMLSLLEGLENVATWYLYPEWSKIGRFHGHGQIMFHDVYGYCMTYVRRLNNKTHLNIDVINDPKDRLEYEKKDSAIMKPVFIKKKLPYPLKPQETPEEVCPILEALNKSH